MLFVPEKRARKALKELKEEREARREERNKEIRAKLLKYSQEYDKKYGL